MTLRMPRTCRIVSSSGQIMFKCDIVQIKGYYAQFIQGLTTAGALHSNLIISRARKKQKTILHRFTKLTQEQKNLPYEDRIDCLVLWILEETRNRDNLTEVYKMHIDRLKRFLTLTKPFVPEDIS
jgi:hypothetical protein